MIMAIAPILLNNVSMKDLDKKLGDLADLFFKENPFFANKEYGNRTIPQAIVDDWIIQHNDIVALDLSYYLYGRLNARLLKSRYSHKFNEFSSLKPYSTS
jgi:hypothetical protein